MDQGKSQRKPSIAIMIMITGLFLLVLLACSSLVLYFNYLGFCDKVAGLPLPPCNFLKTAPERSFTTRELLINLSEMLPGWTVSDPPQRLIDECNYKDASVIIFQANTDFPWRRAMQRVYQYRSASGARPRAKQMYEGCIVPGQFGSTPPEWTYQSPVADQSYFACDARQGQPLNCQWSGRYEEYVVVFGSWIIPDRMSLQDMERVIRAIDMRMAQYLGKPYPDVPARP